MHVRWRFFDLDVKAGHVQNTLSMAGPSLSQIAKTLVSTSIRHWSDAKVEVEVQSNLTREPRYCGQCWSHRVARFLGTDYLLVRILSPITLYPNPFDRKWCTYIWCTCFVTIKLKYVSIMFMQNIFTTVFRSKLTVLDNVTLFTLPTNILRIK